MAKPLKSVTIAKLIGQQIEALNELISEMEEEQLSAEAMAWRIKSVENQLRQLRESSR